MTWSRWNPFPGSTVAVWERVAFASRIPKFGVPYYVEVESRTFLDKEIQNPSRRFRHQLQHVYEAGLLDYRQRHPAYLYLHFLS